MYVGINTTPTPMYQKYPLELPEKRGHLQPQHSKQYREIHVTGSSPVCLKCR